jgi:subtilisin-like proprotein convertase family protein
VKSPVSERGASLVVVAPSNGGTRGIATTTLNNGFTLNFGGTSAAAPLASGVVALLLEANPDLTWRDVPLILAQSARKCDPAEAGWLQNGAGRWINEKYGYGAIDAGAAATLAESWTRLPHEISYDSGVVAIETALPDGVNAGITRTLDLTDAAPIMRIETVELILNVSAEFLGDISVTLTAPDGTVSNLARRRGDGAMNYINYVFTTKRHIGERADGVWTVKVADGADGDLSTWHDYRLLIHGAPRCPGDLDEDGAFELDDLLLMLGGFGPCEPDAAFRPGADVDNSGCNDLADLMRVIENFGQNCP